MKRIKDFLLDFEKYLYELYSINVCLPIYLFFICYFESNFCLLDRSKSDMIEYDERERKIELDQNRIYPGEIYDSYEQCQRLNGHFSTPCFVRLCFRHLVKRLFIS